MTHVILFLFVAVVFPFDAFAQQPDILSLLSRIESLPTKSEFEKVPDIEAKLLKLAAEHPNEWVRDAALSALAQYWPTDSALNLLENTMIAASADRKIALLYDGRFFGDPLLDVMELLCNDQNDEVVFHTLRVAVLINTTRSREFARLNQRMLKEKYRRAWNRVIARRR